MLHWNVFLFQNEVKHIPLDGSSFSLCCGEFHCEDYGGTNKNTIKITDIARKQKKFKSEHLHTDKRY